MTTPGAAAERVKALEKILKLSGSAKVSWTGPDGDSMRTIYMTAHDALSPLPTSGSLCSCGEPWHKGTACKPTSGAGERGAALERLEYTLAPGPPQGLHPECALVCSLASARGEADAREERLASDLAQAREALRKYGTHPTSCPKGVGIGVYKPPANARCSCGIDAALAGEGRP